MLGLWCFDLAVSVVMVGFQCFKVAGEMRFIVNVKTLKCIPIVGNY